MAAYDITAPDGKTYRLEGPAGASKIDLINALAVKYPMAVQTTEELEAAPRASGSAGNILRGLGSSVLGATKSLIDVTGAGTGISKSLGELSQELESGITPERQEEMQRRQELIDRANRSGSFLKEAKAYLGGVAEAPIESAVRGVGSSVPAVLAGFAALPFEAPAALALGVSTISRIAVGAAQGVGEYKGSVFDAVKNKYMEAGKSEAEAEQLAVKAQEYSANKALEIGGSALLGALDAYTGAEAAATGAFKKVAKPNTQEGLAQAYKNLGTSKPLTSPNPLGSFVGSMAGEAPLEGLQGGFGQYAQNVGVQKAGFEQAPFEGVLGASLRDAAVGALTGGVFTPLNHIQRSRDFALDQYLRTQGPIAVANEQREARRKELEETRSRVEQGLGISKTLALPAPDLEKFEEEPAGKSLQNPVGNIKRDMLDPKVVRYIDNYRRSMNMPRLDSYSIEDIKDAMTQVNPKGEQAALDSALTALTGYTGEVKYTPQDILNAAKEKQIATGTKGFHDFIRRTTGAEGLFKTDAAGNQTSNLSQPQLHAVFEALKNERGSETGQETVLPEGSNASRFDKKQYNQAIKMVNFSFGELGNVPLSPDTIVQEIKDATKLETDRDARTLLDTAIKNGDLQETKEVVYRTYDPETDKLVSTYRDKTKAKEAAEKKGLNVREETLTSIKPAEPKVAAVKQTLPNGYEITEGMFKAGEKPEQIDIVTDTNEFVTTLPT